MGILVKTENNPLLYGKPKTVKLGIGKTLDLVDSDCRTTDLRWTCQYFSIYIRKTLHKQF